MTIPDEYQAYVLALRQAVKSLSPVGLNLELDPVSTPICSPDAAAIDYKLREVDPASDRVMFLRIHLTSHHSARQQHELSLDAKMRLRMACEAFCSGGETHFEV